MLVRAIAPDRSSLIWRPFPRGYVDQMHIAAIYDALGEKDKAFATLDCACDSCSRSGKPNAVLFVAGAPLFTDARFATLEMKVAHSAISSALEVNP